MHVDPVCSRPVSDDEPPPLRTEYAGEEYFFCSTTCLERFESELDLFTLGPGAASLANRDRGLRTSPSPTIAPQAKLEQAHCH